MISGAQQTINDGFEIAGAGLHQGVAAHVQILPAPENHGFVFRRIDLRGAPEVALDIQFLGNAQRRTQLEKGAAIVHTTEHVVAGLFGMGVDNALIEISGEEPPAMDGSALLVAQAVQRVGLSEQDAARRVVSPEEHLKVEAGNAWITLSANDKEGFLVEYLLDYGAPELPPSAISFDWSPERFLNEIASARTFCLESEAKALQAAGFGLGANTQNTLVVGRDGVVDNTLRFEDEFARHKVLDLIGDFALLGARLNANVQSERSGHSLNHQMIRKLCNG